MWENIFIIATYARSIKYQILIKKKCLFLMSNPLYTILFLVNQTIIFSTNYRS